MTACSGITPTWGGGNDVRFAGNVMTPAAAGGFLHHNLDYSTGTNFPPLVGILGSAVDYINNTFAHEGEDAADHVRIIDWTRSSGTRCTNPIWAFTPQYVPHGVSRYNNE